MVKGKVAYGCPFCGFITKGPLEWKNHVLNKHGLHYTKWHESIPDAEPSPATSLNATVTQAAKDRTVTGTLTQSTKHDAQTFLSARIDTATATTNVEIRSRSFVTNHG